VWFSSDSTTKEGFLPGAQLGFKEDSATGDYHGQMNYDNFSKWISSQFLSNFPPSGVIIMNNVPYHINEHNKAPVQSANKQAMEYWLKHTGLSDEMSMMNIILLDNTERLKCKIKCTRSKIIQCLWSYCEPGSLSLYSNGLWAGQLVLNSWQGQKIFLYTTVYGLPLGQHPI
jgi:hypothetical protein